MDQITRKELVYYILIILGIITLVAVIYDGFNRLHQELEHHDSKPMTVNVYHLNPTISNAKEN